MVSKKLGDGETAADIIFSHRSKSYNKNVKVFRRGPEFLPQPLRVADNARPLICENLCNLQTLDLESIILLNGANGMNTPYWEAGGWTALAAW